MLTASSSQHPLVFVSCSPSREIAVLAFDRVSGTLTELGRHVVPVDGMPVAGGMPLVFSPDRRFLYAGIRQAPHPIVSLAVAPHGGALRPLGAAPLPERAASLATDHTGRHLFAVSYGGHFLSVGPIDESGVAREPAQVIENLPQAHGIAIDRSDHHVYVACMGADAVQAYRFDPAHGRLEQRPFDVLPSAAGAGPRHLALAADGRHLYAVTEHHGTVMVFERDGSSGRLAAVQTVGFLPETILAAAAPAIPRPPPGAADIHLTPDGRFLYASDRPTNSIGVFRVDQESGQLSPIENVSAEATPRSFAIDADGRHLLCLGVSSGRIGVYAIEPDTGRLRRRSTFDGVAEVVDWIEVIASS